jgi:hypothetical protein
MDTLNYIKKSIYYYISKCEIIMWKSIEKLTKNADEFKEKEYITTISSPGVAKAKTQCETENPA